ncbi:MAG: hypothetical protein ACREYE_06710 [Gammaproteobacteria bacterium]
MATGEAPPDTEANDGKNPAAVALGRLGGLKGGRARAAALSDKQRSEIAKKAAAKRWAKNDIWVIISTLVTPTRRKHMAARKSFLGPAPNHPELDKLLKKARTTQITEEELQEQRVSFAYGNAPESANITKDSIRSASKSIRMARG